MKLDKKPNHHEKLPPNLTRPHITYLSKPLHPQSSGPVFTFLFKNSFNLFSRISEMAVTWLALSGDHVMSPVNGVTFTSLQKAKGQVRCVGQCVYNTAAYSRLAFKVETVAASASLPPSGLTTTPWTRPCPLLHLGSLPPSAEQSPSPAPPQPSLGRARTSRWSESG